MDLHSLLHVDDKRERETYYLDITNKIIKGYPLLSFKFLNDEINTCHNRTFILQILCIYCVGWFFLGFNKITNN